MEAHAGSISIGTATARPRRWLTGIREQLRQRRLERAERAYRLRVNAAQTDSVQGSEHTHLIRPLRGF